MTPTGRRAARGRLRCQDVVELVTDYLEAVLPPPVHARIQVHLRSCRNCAAYLLQMQVMVRALGRLVASPPDPRAKDDLVRLYRTWTAA